MRKPWFSRLSEILTRIDSQINLWFTQNSPSMLRLTQFFIGKRRHIFYLKACEMAEVSLQSINPCECRFRSILWIHAMTTNHSFIQTRNQQILPPVFNDRFEYRKLALRAMIKTNSRYPDLFYLLDWYLVAAFVPSETACLASSPGRIKRTEVWISREEMVDLLL